MTSGPVEQATASRSARVGLRIRTTLPEVAVVLGLLGFLVWLVFGDFISGRSSPQFDFLGAYNAEAFAWWTDGSFFQPPEWVPYTWGGYPAGTSLQNSSWYLPVGIAANLTFYDIHAAAVVHVLHIAFGALGVYTLGRRWGLGRLVATFGLAASFFVAGFYSNAQHVDIVRGYAWTPWFLLVLSPWWPWKRWWSVPVAAVVVWQILAGVYPGILVAMFYVGLVWVVALQLLNRPRFTDFLLPLAVSAGAGVLLVVVKYLPAVVIKGVSSPTGADDSAFGIGIFGTFFFGYSGENLPTDMSMRPYFVPVTCLALLALVPWRSVKVRAVALVIGLATLMSLPIWPWFDLVGALPGANLSRFRTSDYRPFILFGVVLLSMLALTHALRRRTIGVDDDEPASDSRERFARSLPFLALLGLLVLAAVLGTGWFDRPLWVPGFSLLICAVLAVGLLVRGGPAALRTTVPDARVVAVLLIALSVASGAGWAFGTTRPWRADRVAAEVETWGVPVDALIARRIDPGQAATNASLPHEQRPERYPLWQDPVGPIESQKLWDFGYYSAEAAVGGYTNLKGNPAFELAYAALLDPATAAAAKAFWAAPGVAFERIGDAMPSTNVVEKCAADVSFGCGDGLGVTPNGFRPAFLSYVLEANSDMTVDLNESYYPGWTGELCSTTDDACRDANLEIGPWGNIAVDVPAGSWVFSASYATPGMSAGWAAFVCGVAVVLVWVIAGLAVDRVVRRPRRESSESRTDGTPA